MTSVGKKVGQFMLAVAIGAVVALALLRAF